MNPWIGQLANLAEAHFRLPWRTRITPLFHGIEMASCFVAVDPKNKVVPRKGRFGSMRCARLDRSTQASLAPLFFVVAMLAPSITAAESVGEESGATYARVRHLDGSLSIEQAAQGEIVEGTVNTPVIAGDVAAMAWGRAEIELADASVLWLDAGARVEFRSLADAQNRYERTNLLAVRQGSIRVQIQSFEDAEAVFQIDTEAGSVFLLSAGSFRIESDGGVTTVSSYGGVAEFSGEGGSVLVRSGQRSSVQSGNAPSEPRRFNTQRLDDFDRFCEERSSAYLESADYGAVDGAENLPPEVRTYAPELSYYGTWYTLPAYGRIWRPRYTGSWSPYYNGYWRSCPTGWVWVSYDPWGWAPYHYGRWDYATNIGWFWAPGVVWSGAWVHYAVGPTYIGWCPLNYWNRPVFHDAWIVNQITVNVGRLDPRGWQFVPVGRFGQRGIDTVVVRGERLPRNQEVVVTQRLPQFDPRVLAKRPDRAAGLVTSARQTRLAHPITQDPGAPAVSFRTIERQTAKRTTGQPGSVRPDRRAAAGKTVPNDRTPGRTLGGGQQTSPGSARSNSSRRDVVTPPPVTSRTNGSENERPRSTTPHDSKAGRSLPPAGGTRPPDRVASTPHDQGSRMRPTEQRTKPTPAAPPTRPETAPRAEPPRGNAVGRLIEGARPKPSTPAARPAAPDREPGAARTDGSGKASDSKPPSPRPPRADERGSDKHKR